MNKTNQSITDPGLDLTERGVVILTRGSAALCKSALRIRIEEVKSWLLAYDPPGQPYSKYSQKIANQRALLPALGAALGSLETWISLAELKEGK